MAEGYGDRGLTLPEHPVTFLRADLIPRRYITCAAAELQRDGRKVQVARLELVREKPGSAKGVMFNTTEDETSGANLIIRPSLFEQQRRIVLTATILAMDGQVQRRGEGEVVRVVVDRVHDLSRGLPSVGQRDAAFPLPYGRGDGSHYGSGGPDPRDLLRLD